MMTLLLFFGFPIIGWICTILAMKNFSLTREKMEEIQIEIAHKKDAEDAAVEAEAEAAVEGAAQAEAAETAE